jgi:hypothetical protein
VARQFSSLVCVGLFALLTACGGGGDGGGSSSGGGNPPPDTIPNGFTFTSQADTALAASVVSNEVTIAGITAAAAISIAGGEYSVDGGAFTSAAGTVTNNQRIRVRVTTPAQFSSGATATLTVGGVSAPFTATTQAMDTTPAAFEFAKIANAARGAWASSASATITGINTAVSVTIANGEYSIAGGGFTSAPGTITSGQTIVVRAQAGAGYSRATRATLTVGTVSVEFEIVSEIPDYAPDATAFDGVDVVFLLSRDHDLVFRWSVSEARYLDAYSVGFAGEDPLKIAYVAAHQRLYLGYGTGAIRYVPTTGTTRTETAFGVTPTTLHGLTSAGNFLLAHDSSGYYGTAYAYNSAGTVVSQGGGYYSYSREYAWDANSSRVYFFRDGFSPNDLHYLEIDAATGEIGAGGETPYHGSYSIQGPIRVSADGQYVLLGSGDLYSRDDLNWVGSLGSQVVDARWSANGSLVTLSTTGSQTTLRRLASGNRGVLEQLPFTGEALRVFGTDTRMTIVALDGGSVRLHTYVPSDDSDGDGVANTADAFPLDRAASLDADRDGYPDAWNPGRSQTDSTTGLTLDAFPSDSACWLSTHGAGGLCDYGATMPDYVPDAHQIAQNGDVVYLLSSANRRVYRWSISGNAYLNPYVVGIDQGFTTIAPTKLAFSAAHNRLYLGYQTGAIRYIDVASGNPAEVAFANTAMAVGGLAAVGNFVLAQDPSGAWATHYIFNQAGAVTDQEEWNYYSSVYEWDANTSRIYFFRDSQSPNDLHYEVIDQATGQIAGEGEAPYHGSYSIIPPIRVSTNGQYVLLGSGDVYAQSTLSWTGSLGSAIADARWFGSGSLVTLATASNQTTLRRLGASNLATLEQVVYAGSALRVVGSDARMAVIVVNDGTVRFHPYVPNDDSDGDGVANTADAFPLDVAASVDSDNDGYPDAWNAGRGQADSTTGLVLDAFANDAACWLPAHGVGGTCDYAATIPNYIPDAIAHHGDTIYLLSSANRRVYRRSISTGQYLNPYIVGVNQGFTTVAPTKMSYSPTHQRLYLGYSTGAIRYIPTSGSPAEVPFATLSGGVTMLASANNFVLAVDGASYYGSTFVLNNAGAIVSQGGGSYAPATNHSWDPASSRLYFFRDNTSPNDLHYLHVDQVTGLIDATGETPYHGSYSIQPPIRVSSDALYILLGSGDMYSRIGLTWLGSIGMPFADARWMSDNYIITLATSGGQTVLRRISNGVRTVVEQRAFTGQALRVIGSDSAMVVLTISGGTVQFHNYVPSNDSDNDGVANTADAFPLDVAASVDTDRDGYPDSWNAGRSQADSTTGLELDAFPNDAACWLSAHGSGGVCDYGATIPNYTPDVIAQHGDTIYLLSSANRRVYRRSISTGQYLNPYIVGIDNGFSTVAPTHMTYSPAQSRLYFGYDTGAIRYIDVTSGGAETVFTNLSRPVNGLASVGNYLLAQDDTGAWESHHIISAFAAVTHSVEWNHYSPEYAWDPNTSRVYFFRGNSSPGDLHYEVIDQSSGLITSAGESPYHGAYNTSGVIRPSGNGAHVLLGSGDIYAQNGLTWSGSLGTQVTDARWFADGSLVTLSTASNQTTLRRLNPATMTVLEQRVFAGQALRIVGSDTLMSVLVLNGGTTQFHAYTPNDDSDGDGVLNTVDAFPLDVAASVDTDSDGYPDSWNAGRDQDDSTTGLVLDSFPNDTACWLPAHGSGGICDYGATIPNYTPDAIAQNGDTIYLLSSANRRVYRRSISTGQYLNPYVVGINQGFSMLAPTEMTYSPAHQRLYFGYETGAIRMIDVTGGGVEVPFANAAMGVHGLAAVGNYVLAQDDSGAWESHYIIDAAGVITHVVEWNYYSPEYAWDTNTSRVYFFRGNQSPSDLHFEVIDQSTGRITSSGETPYHGSYGTYGVIRPSVNGAFVLLGSGDLYAQGGLTWAGSLGTQVTDARWFADGTLVTLVTSGNQTTLRRMNPSTLAVLEQRVFAGEALRIVGSDTVMSIVVLNAGTTQFHAYVPNNDSDNDGVLNTVDAFPLDVAASVDTDRDGHPDAWNAGRDDTDSTTGLVLDAFPSDAACWLPAHGSGGVCNYGATIPNYTPDAVATHGDVIYLLSSANRRVYRWSMATGQYLNPYIIGIDQGLTTIAPTKMALSTAHQRLYLGYETGAIRSIDLTAGHGAETAFTNVAMAVGGLASVGNYVLAQDASGAWATHYVINSAGVITDQEEWNYVSNDYTWDPVNSRVYFFRLGVSPGDMHYEVIDQTNGQIVSHGETPYHGDFSMLGPIRVSPDGERVLLGAGTLFDRASLTIVGSVGGAVADAHWTDEVLVTLDETDRVAIRDPLTNAELRAYQYTGTPERLAFGTTEAYLVHILNGTTSFIRLPFYDTDGDTMPRWWEQLYSLSDTNAADGAADGDSDGVDNAAEHANGSDPTLADTDADGLGDALEINTHHTRPAVADTDGDGLNDGPEVTTHHTDPLDVDSDDDGYPDQVEVLYGGDPNDVSDLPTPMTSHSQGFEGVPDLTAWGTPAGSMAPWATDTTVARTGSASFKSGAVTHYQYTSTRFRGVFATGTLRFYARVEADSCCDYLQVLVNGVVVSSTSATQQWVQVSVPIASGLRDIEFRYQKDHYAYQTGNAAWIDDVTFAP